MILLPKKILDGVSTKFKTFNRVKATFTYKVENASGKNLSTKTGSILNEKEPNTG